MEGLLSTGPTPSSFHNYLMINQPKLMFKKNIAYELDFKPNTQSVIYIFTYFKHFLFVDKLPLSEGRLARSGDWTDKAMELQPQVDTGQSITHG